MKEFNKCDYTSKPLLLLHPTNMRICLIYCGIRRSGFDSRHFQKKKVMGLERGPLSLVRTTEELLDRKVAAPV
jgi:hypothetical protein